MTSLEDSLKDPKENSLKLFPGYLIQILKYIVSLLRICLSFYMSHLGRAIGHTFNSLDGRWKLHAACCIHVSIQFLVLTGDVGVLRTTEEAEKSIKKVIFYSRSTDGNSKKKDVLSR